MPTFSDTSSMDRKSKKPLMEKRRRARINQCLGDLKTLLLESLKKNPAETSKLEKADILEMTVHLLRSLQSSQLMMAVRMDPAVLDRFQGGWAECYQQVMHYANSVEGFNPEVRARMFRHLENCFSGIDSARRSGQPHIQAPRSGPSGPQQVPPLPLPARVPLNGGRPLWPPGVPHPGMLPNGAIPPNQPRMPNLSPGDLALLAAAAGLPGPWQTPVGRKGPIRGQNRPHSTFPTPLQLAQIPNLLSNLETAQLGNKEVAQRSPKDDQQRHDSFLSVKTESTDIKGEWSSPNTVDNDEESDSSVFGDDERDRSGGTDGSLEVSKEDDTEVDVDRVSDTPEKNVWRPW